MTYDLVAHESIIAQINELKSELMPRSQLYEEFRKVKADMVTKSYLDSKLVELRRDILSALKNEDSELRKIESLMPKK